MLILFIVKVLAFIFMSVFGLICFAQGLFYLADVVEEHGTIAKKALRMILYAEIAIHVLLLFDGDVPFLQVFLGLLAHLLYLALLPQFPFVDVKSPIALASVAAALVNHFSWFFHVLLTDTYLYSYSEMASIFVICVWLCPLAFIVSLSSTEPLPVSNSPLSSGMESDDGESRRKGHSLFAVFLNFLKSKSNSLLPTNMRSTTSPSSMDMQSSDMLDANSRAFPLSSETQMTGGSRRSVQPMDDSSKFM